MDISDYRPDKYGSSTSAGKDTPFLGDKIPQESFFPFAWWDTKNWLAKLDMIKDEECSMQMANNIT
jgi:hypothetical protein